MRPPPLRGLRVLDFGQMIAVPYVTQVLGWLGAEVILVENPHLQSVRILPPYAEGVRGINRSGGFNMMSTNKRSLVLDIGVPEGLAIAKRLAAVSDVVVENFTTGVADKLGLAYEDIRAVRPDVVYLSVAAFGRSGPLKNFAGFHSVVNLFTGVAATTGYPGGHPRILGGFPPDFIGGCASLLAVLQAVRHRARTGEGQSVETSMTEAFTTFIPQAVADYSLHGVEPKAVGNRHPTQAPHGIYVCRGDQRWIAISVHNDEAWEALCEVAGRPGWRNDPRFATAADRCANVEAVESLIEEWTRNEDAPALAERLQRAGVRASEVLDSAGTLTDEHLLDRGFVATVEHPEVGSRPMGITAWRIDGERPSAFTAAPLLGEHSRAILGDLLRMDAEEIDDLVRRGIVIAHEEAAEPVKD